jgi:hypothetical protein
MTGLPDGWSGAALSRSRDNGAGHRLALHFSPTTPPFPDAGEREQRITANDVQ